MSTIDHVYANNKLLAIIVSREHAPDATEFVTTPDQNLQVGFVHYPDGGIIQPHIHRPIERQIVGTGEVLFVRSGRAELTLHGEDRELADSRIVQAGDLIILIAGAHGFRMLEETVLLEVKQGPYGGPDEKERL